LVWTSGWRCTVHENLRTPTRRTQHQRSQEGGISAAVFAALVPQATRQ
jgi:hypothetical protein